MTGPVEVCAACQAHRHQRCARHLAALGAGTAVVGGDAECGCPTGCHPVTDDPLLSEAALADMQTHGTLVAFVQAMQAWLGGSGPLHSGMRCLRCQALDTHHNGVQQALPITTPARKGKAGPSAPAGRSPQEPGDGVAPGRAAFLAAREHRQMSLRNVDGQR